MPNQAESKKRQVGKAKSPKKREGGRSQLGKGRGGCVRACPMGKERVQLIDQGGGGTRSKKNILLFPRGCKRRGSGKWKKVAIYLKKDPRVLVHRKKGEAITL